MRKNKKIRKKFSFGVLILNIAIGIAGLMVLLMTITLISETRIATPYYYKDSTFVWSLNEGNYNNMVEYYHENEGKGIKVNAQMQEYYAVARYYEAAVYYRAFDHAGDSVRAEYYLGKMQEAGRDFGELDGLKSGIRKQLNINLP